MKLENTQIQMRKGILEFCILQIISRGEVYASDMLEELTSAKIMVVEGTLYPLLTRLRKAGLVDYKWVESNSGPPRKYYTITESGTDFLTKGCLNYSLWNLDIFVNTVSLGFTVLPFTRSCPISILRPPGY